jgi:hypothetical protein
VAFAIENGHVTVVAATFTLESAYGSVEPVKTPEDFKAVSRAAKEDHVEDVTKKLRRE